MKTSIWRKPTRLTSVLAAAACFGIASEAVAQDPGGDQPPYILFVLDTSGSTEWTDAGDERYPVRNPAAYGGTDPLPGNPAEWVPGTFMDIDPLNPVSGPRAFGSCMVWETMDCDNYVRPAWYYSDDASFPDSWKPWDSPGPNGNRFATMRGNASTSVQGVRLEPESQPRHVTLKEVLTGQMVLAPENYSGDLASLNPTTEGPGCWFVRRQKGASVQPMIEQDYCTVSPANFTDLPDHDEPRPHFQEVSSGRIPGSGIIEKYAGNAIFAVAMLDGYKEDLDGNGGRVNWDDDLNDSITGTMPNVAGWPTNGAFGITNTGRSSGNNEDNNNNYNLGVYRIVGPSDLEVPRTLLPQLADFVQLTINDAGMLGDDDFDNHEVEADKGSEWLGLVFDKKADKYMKMKYRLGKQPVAKATPLAAAVADVHQFMAEDIQFKDEDSVGDSKADEFARCRGKHVILVTDGFPEPERPGSPSNDLGASGLTEAFGFTNPDRYLYHWAEEEITALVGSNAIYPQTSEGDLRRQFGPRVHIVSLDVQDDVAFRDQIAEKLGSMAEAGNTCASASLPARVQAPAGSCDPSLTWCLVDQPATQWIPPNQSSNTLQTCDDAAVMITSNRPSDVEEALAAVVSTILGEGKLQSRTRAAVTNNLDSTTAPAPAGGQYRFYSGVDTRGIYWRGILNRQGIYCSATGDVDFVSGDSQASAGVGTSTEIPMHTQIADQVDCNPVSGVCSTLPATDSRRIFTSVPTGSLWDYASKTTVPGASLSMPNADDIFFWTYDLATATTDEFRGHRIPGSVGSPLSIVGTRVPFHQEPMKTAFIDATTSPVSYTWDETAFFDYWGYGASDNTVFDEFVDTYRGRIAEKTGVEPRVLSGILNSNPTIVGPPELDLPIESYRAFKARYGDRPTMLYVATTDGQIHAIHTGQLEGRISVRDSSVDGTGSETDPSSATAEDQREAWAYVPNFIHRSMSSTVYSEPYFMDGTPAVKDVRLCQANADENQNTQACRAIASSAGSALAPDQQWRTTMVVGAGSAGAGVVALDITRPGGLTPGASTESIDPPDPIVLWEFDRRWEEQQLAKMYALGGKWENAVGVSASSDSDNDDANCASSSDSSFWLAPRLGQTVSQPEIATLQVSYDGGNKVRQRPVAVFGAGLPMNDASTNCGNAGVGQAIYVVDLQTGSILRRFVDYSDPDGGRYTFHRSDVEGFGTEAVSLSGSPALFDSFTGAVATRGFIGDSRGRLFKMNFSDPDPLNWDVSLFFDPYDSGSQIQTALTGDPLGPAGFKPAIARGPNKQLVVTYGLGEPGEITSSDQVQAVVTLEETTIAGAANLRWFVVFEEGEKMTGDPLIFNGITYFPTYAVPAADNCEPGTARIWALDYYADYGEEKTGTRNYAPIGEWSSGDFGGAIVDGSPDCPDGTPGACAKWFGPPDPTLIRGLTLTVGPICSVRNAGSLGEDSSGLEGADAQPQLIAQTSGATAGSGLDQGTSGTDAISRIVVDVAKPRSMTVPLSWSVIGN